MPIDAELHPTKVTENLSNAELCPEKVSVLKGNDLPKTSITGKNTDNFKKHSLRDYVDIILKCQVQVIMWTISKSTVQEACVVNDKSH